jgi:hypothetical protein
VLHLGLGRRCRCAPPPARQMHERMRERVAHPKRVNHPPRTRWIGRSGAPIPVKARPVQLDSRVELHGMYWLRKYLFTVKKWDFPCSSTPESS